MREIGIAGMIAKKRREKGVTQEELAEYLCITKASVSKWETGISYPDILFLPRLAAYFNISIDDLMCYTPQLTGEDIRKAMIGFREEFGQKPFGEVKEKCVAFIQKYYSCIPLLMQMALLYVNHYMLAKSSEETIKTLNEALLLCDRVQQDGEDIQEIKEALNVKAIIYQLLGKPEQILELLGEDIMLDFSDNSLIIAAYQMQGNIEKAKQLIQINLYGHLNELLETLAKELQLFSEDKTRTDEIIRRGMGLIDVFVMEDVFANAVVRFYFQAAAVLIGQGRKEETILMLKRYTDIGIAQVVDFSFHGDAFFDRLDDFFSKIDSNTCGLRSQKTINADLLAGICLQELFGSLKDDENYQNLVKKLRRAVEK